MRALALLIGTLALVQPCLSLEPLEAARVLYYYFAYDLDVEVWGPGNGRIAPKCLGAKLPDGRCTFDEFINYLDTGSPSSTPKYYEVSSSFSLYIGDVLAMVEAIRVMRSPATDHIPRIVQGRTKAIGLFDDLATLLDENHKRADLKKIGIARHKTNIKESLKGLSFYARASAEGGLAARLQAWNQNVNWKIVNQESAYVKNQWRMIDWQATVAANKDLLNKDSLLYKNTVEAIKGHAHLSGNLADKTMAFKAANTFRMCYGG